MLFVPSLIRSSKSDISLFEGDISPDIIQSHLSIDLWFTIIRYLSSRLTTSHIPSTRHISTPKCYSRFSMWWKHVSESIGAMSDLNIMSFRWGRMNVSWQDAQAKSLLIPQDNCDRYLNFIFLHQEKQSYCLNCWTRKASISWSDSHDKIHTLIHPCPVGIIGGITGYGESTRDSSLIYFVVATFHFATNIHILFPLWLTSSRSSDLIQICQNSSQSSTQFHSLAFKPFVCVTPSTHFHSLSIGWSDMTIAIQHFEIVMTFLGHVDLFMSIWIHLIPDWQNNNGGQNADVRDRHFPSDVINRNVWFHTKTFGFQFAVFFNYSEITIQTHSQSLCSETIKSSQRRSDS
jgi:hypothetical protein